MSNEYFHKPICGECHKYYCISEVKIELTAFADADAEVDLINISGENLEWLGDHPFSARKIPVYMVICRHCGNIESMRIKK